MGPNLAHLNATIGAPRGAIALTVLRLDRPGRGRNGRHDESTALVGEDPPIPPGDEPETTPELTAAEKEAIRELVRQPRAFGTSLTGTDGLLEQRAQTRLTAWVAK